MLEQLRFNAARFFYKVTVEENNCCTWEAARQGRGYGHFWLNGHHMLAHRVSWVIHYGPIPEGMMVLHRCDNPGCVNPQHLFLGSQQENMLDMISKGRHSRIAPRGEKSGSAKLKTTDVIKMREWRRDGIKLKFISTYFGVSVPTVCQITTGQTWTHV